MNARQIELKVVLSLVAVVIASSAAIEPLRSAVRDQEIILDVLPSERRNGSIAQALLVTEPLQSAKAKRSPVRSPSAPAYEPESAEKPGAIWDVGPAYDLSSTGQASIYIYVPE